MIQKEKQKTKEEIKPSDPEAKDLTLKKEDLNTKADEIIDQIDNILEKNAEEFVKAYIQKGANNLMFNLRNY